LGQCLKHAKCPIERGARDNLSYLLKLRHEIEHQSTGRLDDAVSAKLQACCINFNDAIKRLFGAQYALERRLPIALPSWSTGPSTALLGPTSRSSWCRPVPTSPEKFNIALKEVERRRYMPTEIVDLMKAEGWRRFTMDSHTKPWKRLNAKDPRKAMARLRRANSGAGMSGGSIACARNAWQVRNRMWPTVQRADKGQSTPDLVCYLGTSGNGGPNFVSRWSYHDLK
jgi:hypothetical protein